MDITERFFQLGSEWNVIHLPEKPSGFGVLIIGDRSHFVNEKTSFSLQHYGRNQLLTVFRNKGYTVFSSNLYNQNWGSPNAVILAKQLYQVVLRKEILNERIHILAEGMGALVALQLMEELKDKIRSVAMLNPCLDLQAHLKNEKDNKFFYKRLLKEISSAYEMDVRDVPNFNFKEMDSYKSSLPVQIWQKMNEAYFLSAHNSKKYEILRRKKGYPIQLIYHLGDNQYRINHSIMKFFKENETVL
ncbi:hypothetical protein ABET51_11900 [Metabacillus fastidiosus]|uniref:hypothetical protein n=1 Tax=Metabacillus fastidiosus TaxID=1458 RepID=UPI002E234E3C|nr:hypothetical protein [Metabacillus fastidiosus]